MHTQHRRSARLLHELKYARTRARCTCPAAAHALASSAAGPATSYPPIDHVELEASKIDLTSLTDHAYTIAKDKKEGLLKLAKDLQKITVLVESRHENETNSLALLYLLAMLSERNGTVDICCACPEAQEARLSALTM